MPRLLRAIVRGFLSADSRFEFAGEIDDPDPRAEDVERSKADFVIAAAPSPALAELGTRLMRDSRVKVLAVSPDARDSFLYVPLGEVAPARLLGVMRAAVRPPLGDDG